MLEQQLSKKVNYVWYAKALAIAMVAYYGIAPVLIGYFNLYPVSWAEENFYFSLALVFFILTLPKVKPITRIRQFVFQPTQISTASVTIAYILAFVSFSFFPWHEVREGVGGSLAAIARAVWLLVVFSFINGSDKAKLVIGGLTLVLMFLDESRTYFFIMLVVLAVSMKAKKFFLALSLAGIVIVAATRMGIESTSGWFFIYGLVGEAFNATKVVGNVLIIKDEEINFVAHIMHTLFQFLIFPIEYTLNFFNFDILPAQSSYLANAFQNTGGESLTPMGGWYIVGDFIFYGWLGLPLMWVYVAINWWACHYFLNSQGFPYGAFIFIISLKATPYIFWKFAFYILAISVGVKILSRVRFRVKQSLA